MKKKEHNNISESQVEEAFVSDLNYLKRVLKLTHDLRLVARQLRLRGGEQRIDLLIASGNQLYLVELKVTPFASENLSQIIEYRRELESLQNQDLLIAGRINAFLLVTAATSSQVGLCRKNDVELVEYDPLEVLENYFGNLTARTPFLKVKPNDYGVFNIGLIHRSLFQLANGLTNEKAIRERLGLHGGSVHNHLRLGKELGLVRERDNSYSLTDLGDQYASDIAEGALIDELTQKQVGILKRFIAEDPFYSSTVFGIYSVVEGAFLLSRNAYPIDLADLRRMFRTVSGKVTEWRSDRAVSTATYTFLNFAIDLELLGKIGRQIVLTPAGLQFILMLQLHKSIEMIESLSSNPM